MFVLLRNNNKCFVIVAAMRSNLCRCLKKRALSSSWYRCRACDMLPVSPSYSDGCAGAVVANRGENTVVPAAEFGLIALGSSR